MPRRKRKAPSSPDQSPVRLELRSKTVVLTASEPVEAIASDESKAWVGAYAVRFSGPGEKDLNGEYFTSATYFGGNQGNGVDVMLNHGEPLGENEVLETGREYQGRNGHLHGDRFGLGR